MWRVGDKLGRFVLDREIGQGSHGVVFLATDTALKAQVAVKILHPWLTQDVSVRDRFKRELLLARRIAHPGVCRLFDLHDEGDAFLITMDYVEGETLLNILKNEGRLEPLRAVKILRGVCSALQAAHQAGVIHRDLKPANIIIRADDDPMILDFGTATASDVSRVTRPGTAVGSMRFIAPEVFSGTSPGVRTDVYSLGVVAYVSLAGKLPYTAAAGAVEMLDMIRTQPVPRLDAVQPDVPGRLADLVARCMEKNPEQRFGSAKAFAEGLDEVDQLLDGAPTKSTKVPSKSSDFARWAPEKVVRESVRSASGTGPRPALAKDAPKEHKDTARDPPSPSSSSPSGARENTGPRDRPASKSERSSSSAPLAKERSSSGSSSKKGAGAGAAGAGGGAGGAGAGGTAGSSPGVPGGTGVPVDNDKVPTKALFRVHDTQSDPSASDEAPPAESRTAVAMPPLAETLPPRSEMSLGLGAPSSPGAGSAGGGSGAGGAPVVSAVDRTVITPAPTGEDGRTLFVGEGDDDVIDGSDEGDAVPPSVDALPTTGPLRSVEPTVRVARFDDPALRPPGARPRPPMLALAAAGAVVVAVVVAWLWPKGDPAAVAGAADAGAGSGAVALAGADAGVAHNGGAVDAGSGALTFTEDDFDDEDAGVADEPEPRPTPDGKPRPRFTGSRVDLEIKAVRKLMLKKAFIPGDLPVAEKKLAQARTAGIRGKTNDAERLVGEARDVVEGQDVDRAFVMAKLSRFNARYDRSRRPDIADRVEPLARDAAQGFAAGDFEVANQKLNRAFALVGKPK